MRRVLGRTPKLPIVPAGNPFLGDFMNPAEAPAAKTHGLLTAIRKTRQSPSADDFQGKLNTTLARRVRNARSEECFSGNRPSLFRLVAKTKRVEMGRAW